MEGVDEMIPSSSIGHWDQLGVGEERMEEIVINKL